jgi:tRNA A-37 threonylcarbamoyl transferase component Bud32
MRKTYGPLKAKDCKLGVSCGGTCIAKKKSCKVNLKPQEKTKVRTAVKTLKAKPSKDFLNLFKSEKIQASTDAKPLGAGAYGIVVLTDGKALKTVKETTRKGKMLKEVGFQIQASALGLAPKVLAFNNNQVLMERAAGSTVASLKSEKKLTPQDLKDYQKVLQKAIISLHKKGIAHNDAHEENIFYDIASKKLTFIDFGFATKADSFYLYDEYKRAMPQALQRQFQTSKDYADWLKLQ